jgi:hypothetical protein
MSDLIERLKRYSCERHDKPQPENCLACEFWADAQDAITALREQDKALKASIWHNEWAAHHLSEDSKEIDHLQARIEELEAAEERSAEYLAESVENEVEALEKIERLDAALKEISLGVVAPMDFAKKARAGE